MRRNTYALVAAAMTVGLATSACNGSNSDTQKTDATSAASSSAAATTTSQATAATTAGESAPLPSLIPTPANSQQTKGPDTIADNGIHMYFQVNGSPNEVMAAYKSALEGKGWAVETIVTSGGGATYTGTHGDAYGVFDGGGFNTSTYIDVCSWPSKPANPNCARSDR
jgi:hypothetical protein